MNNRMLLATLALSASAFVGLANYEGFRSTPYNDGVGVSTIGFGTTAGVKPGDTITVERALVRALGDVNTVERHVQRCVTVPLYQHEYDAYVLLAYNIGPTAFCNSTLVKKLNALDYAGACAQISRWNSPNNPRVTAGLTKRRAGERVMCEGRK